MTSFVCRPCPLQAGGLQGRLSNTEDAVKALQSGVTDKYKLFVVCETIQQAGAVAKAMGVKKINLGNVAFSENARQVSTSVFLTPENEAYVKSCSARAMNCSFR